SEQFKMSERHKLNAMLGLCETTGCRRKTLLRYFADDAAEHCGNCDNCQIPPETWDASEDAQKALSCIYRTGQRFGVVHIIDVLLGRETEKVAQFSHQQLSTFGIGSTVGEGQWRSLIRQLVVRGLLDVDVDGYGGLKLTDQCRPVLRGEQTLLLRRDLAANSRGGKGAKSARRSAPVAAEHEQLWSDLRDCRKRLATDFNVPPYVIFHDATLQEMIERRPMSRMDLLTITGVGQSKLDKYGAEFIEVICSHAEAGL
ncbi:MAG: ATP-dependent DNA helicase RecQ, partial [Paraglaciecola psychrophila]